MGATTKDLLLHEPRLAVLHPREFDDASLLAHYLGSRLITEMDPEVVLLRWVLGAPHFAEKPLTSRHWITSTFSPRDTTVAAYRSLVEEVVSYATHVLLFWDGESEWLHECLQGEKAIKRPVKMVRLS